MKTLSEYIAEKNEASRVWAAAGENRWAGMLVDDVAYWAESGVHTPADLDKYLLVCDVFELTRSAYGYKPSWSGLMGMTMEQLNAEADSLAVAAREAIERDREMQAWYEEQDAREAREQAEAEKRAFTREEWTVGMAFAVLGL